MLDHKSVTTPFNMSVPMQRTPKAEYTLNCLEYQRRLSAGKLPSMTLGTPRSHSSSLVDTLNAMPASYYQLHSAFPSKIRDDTVPNQRHLAEHLAASTMLDPATLFAAMNNDPYINERRKPLSRTIISHTDPAVPPPYIDVPDESEITHLVARLQNIPTELLYIIRDMLEPAGVVCMALTSRHLFHLLNYQLIDLRNLLFINPSGSLAQIIYAHALEYRVRQQIHTVTEALTRDRLSKLAAQETFGSSGFLGLTCSVCVKTHPRWYFNLFEMSQPASQRKCLASTAPIRLCEHWTENLIFLRALKKKQRLFPHLYPADSGPGYICGHPDHVITSSTDDFSAPRMLEVPGSGGSGSGSGGGKWKVQRDMTVVLVAERSGLTLPLVREVLKKKRSETKVCRHVNLGEDYEIVLAGLAKGAKYSRRITGHADSECAGGSTYSEVYWPEFESTECEECGTMWRFSIIDTGLGHAWPRYALKLTVVEPLVAVKDPWAKGWLSKVEGGEDLMRLKWK